MKIQGISSCQPGPSGSFPRSGSGSPSPEHLLAASRRPAADDPRPGALCPRPSPEPATSSSSSSSGSPSLPLVFSAPFLLFYLSLTSRALCFMPWHRASIRQGHHRSKQHLLHLGLPAPVAPSRRPYAASRTHRSLDSPATRSPSRARGLLPPRCPLLHHLPVLLHLASSSRDRPRCRRPRSLKPKPPAAFLAPGSGVAAPDRPVPRPSSPGAAKSRSRLCSRGGGCSRIAALTTPLLLLVLRRQSVPARPSPSRPTSPPPGPWPMVRNPQRPCPVLACSSNSARYVFSWSCEFCQLSRELPFCRKVPHVHAYNNSTTVHHM
nr:formin-like protein 13 isoform X1 [Aegilops tauschii subsp. strangulata]